MCGTINPVGNVYCQKCSARLVPMSSMPEGEESEEKTSPIQGFSLPTVPLDEAEEEQEGPHVEENQRDESPPEEDWLDELRGSADQQPQRIEDDERTTDDEELLEPADIPEWLSDLGPISEVPSRRTSTETPSSHKAPAEEATAHGDMTDMTPTEPPPEQADTAEQPSHPAPAELDAWETDVAQSSEEEPVPEPADIPDWLRDMAPLRAEPRPFPGKTPEETQEPSGEEAETEQPQAEGPGLEGIPRWLQDTSLPDEDEAAPSNLRSTSVAESETAGAEPPIIEIPDWLREAQADMPPQPPEEPVAGEEPQVPEEPEETRAQAEAAPTQPSPESVEIPGWLREAEAAEEKPPETEAEPEVEKATSTEIAPGSVEIPSWLQESDVEPREEAGAVSRLTEAPSAVGETPDWLAELMTPAPEDEGETPPVPAEPGITGEEWDTGLERADIPDWLQELRPRQGEGKEAIRGPLETEGLLKGLRGLIPATHAIGAPGTFEGLPTSQTSEASLARAELLQSLLGQPTIQPAAKPRRVVGERRTDAAALVERWLVAGFLMIAVVGMLLAPLIAGQSLLLTQPPTVTGASSLHRTIDGLGANDHILVAFDYGPPEADELSVAAEPVLTHVLERGAQISIVTTRPDGLLIAEAMMARIADAKDQYRFIGYRPGAATAISQLLTATDRAPTLLLILTSRPMPLRLWIEQASARSGDRLPLVAVGSAALEPVASPYLDANAGQLGGAIHGLQGAAAYEALRESAGSATQRLDALAAGHLAIVVLIIVGAVAHVLGGPKEEKT